VTGDKRQVTRKFKNEVGYKRLVAWQVADDLASKVYRVTDKFPKDESFGLTSQLRRAALSVPLNIVEGHSRNSKNEFRQFLRIALGSLAEVDYLLYFSLKREYISKAIYDDLTSLRITCGKILWKLMKSQ
jgi:four helix bundle protein